MGDLPGNKIFEAPNDHRRESSRSQAIYGTVRTL
jgi:hypothetical protein